MLRRFGSAVIFVSGSVVGGLALAFLVVATHPELLRGGPRPPAVTGTPAAPRAATAPERSAGTAAPAAAAGAAATAPALANGPGRTSYADAVERAAPAVVNIYTARLVTERVAPTLGEMFGEFVPRYRQRVERSLGSGVIVDADGHIVTNHHVIASADSIRVQLADGRVAEARIVGRDPDTDLAVLRIDLKALPVISFGRSDRLRVGDVVLAIGDPIGLSHTVTHGIVSAVSRQQLGITPLEDFIQTDAPINFGNSGGALVDTSGALVGINTAIVAKNLGVEGIGFAIPVNMVRGVLGEIIAHGRVVRGWIGIVPEDLGEEQARRLGLPGAAVIVANLYVGSPAQHAGIVPGDVLLAIDGVAPRGALDALGRIAGRRPGSSVVLRTLRDGRTLEVRTEVAERPHAN